MRVNVECKIDMQQMSPRSEAGDTERRQEILQVITAHRAEGNWPDAECIVMDTWELVIDEIRGWVLQDVDWQMDGRTLDLPPEKSREFKRRLGIHDDYFTDVPPDVNDEQACAAWADIVELVDGQRPEEAVFD